MSPAKMNTILFFTYALYVGTTTATEAAYSHVFHQTPDFKFEQQQFHENSALATPIITKNEEQLSATLSEIINPSANPDLQQHVPEYFRDSVPLAFPSEEVLEKLKNDLPSGYVKLPAKIDPPPGYQLYSRNNVFY